VTVAFRARFSAAELEQMRAAAERVHQRLVEAGDSAEAPPVDCIDNQRYQMLRGGTVKWEWKSAGLHRWRLDKIRNIGPP
jgi:hypothetical protein